MTECKPEAAPHGHAPVDLWARPLVLASTSRYRASVLSQLGIPFAAAVPRYEEEHGLSLPPEELVLTLAERKALSLGETYADRLIVGSDQVAELDGELLLKPGSVPRAEAQLARLAGRTHRLITGVVVVQPSTGRIERALDVHTMTLRPLSTAEIAAYVAQEQPIDCAGSYKIEGPGIALFESMRGEDYTGIIGLPLTKLVGLLLRFVEQFPFGQRQRNADD